jgi:putative glutamine amidotransferase
VKIAARPLIGITRPDRGDGFSYVCAWLSLWLSGARPVAIRAGRPREDLPLDGLLLAGGQDVHPALFHDQPKADYAYDLDREAMELAWLDRARTADLPTLGVCRGAQLMNVGAGGALQMDLAAAYPLTRYPGHWLEQLVFRKTVRIEAGSTLAAVAGSDAMSVNSIHRQAIGRLGSGLVVTARETNGVIQAIEDPSRRFWLGLQFHPEYLFYRRRPRLIFRAFVSAAARYRLARGGRASERRSTPGTAPGVAGL